jgi:hypothetical protein
MNESKNKNALVIKTVWNKEFNVGLIQIIEQKFRGDEFFKGKRTFESSNGITIKSLRCPEITEEDIFYIRGECIEKDNKVCIVDDYMRWKAIIEAVGYYNDSVGYYNSMDTTIDYLDLHYRTWMKLSESGSIDKFVCVKEVLKEAGLKIFPKNGCFLCEEVEANNPKNEDSGCSRCKGYWGSSSPGCTSSESYYKLWDREKNIDLRKALAKRIANNTNVKKF